MSTPQARMLLIDLTEFATRQQFVYPHAWRVNDFVMWDNRSTQRCIADGGSIRTRCAISGRPGLREMVGPSPRRLIDFLALRLARPSSAWAAAG